MVLADIAIATVKRAVIATAGLHLTAIHTAQVFHAADAPVVGHIQTAHIEVAYQRHRGKSEGDGSTPYRGIEHQEENKEQESEQGPYKTGTPLPAQLLPLCLQHCILRLIMVVSIHVFLSKNKKGTPPSPNLC